MRRFEDLTPDEQEQAIGAVYQALHDLVWDRYEGESQRAVPRPKPGWFTTSRALDKRHYELRFQWVLDRMHNLDTPLLRTLARQAAEKASYPSDVDMVVFLQGDPKTAARIALGRGFDKSFAACYVCMGRGMVRRDAAWHRCDRCNGSGTLIPEDQ